MFFEMVCSCSATLQIDAPEDRELAVWLFVTRFSEAHVNCGFMTPVTKDEPETTKRYEVSRAENHEEKEI